MIYSKEIPLTNDSKDLKYISNELEKFKKEFQEKHIVASVPKHEIRIKKNNTSIIFTIYLI